MVQEKRRGNSQEIYGNIDTKMTLVAKMVFKPAWTSTSVTGAEHLNINLRGVYWYNIHIYCIYSCPIIMPILHSSSASCSGYWWPHTAARPLPGGPSYCSTEANCLLSWLHIIGICSPPTSGQQKPYTSLISENWSVQTASMEKINKLCLSPCFF